MMKNTHCFAYWRILVPNVFVLVASTFRAVFTAGDIPYIYFRLMLVLIVSGIKAMSSVVGII